MSWEVRATGAIQAYRSTVLVIGATDRIRKDLRATEKSPLTSLLKKLEQERKNRSQGRGRGDGDGFFGL